MIARKILGNVGANIISCLTLSTLNVVIEREFGIRADILFIPSQPAPYWFKGSIAAKTFKGFDGSNVKANDTAIRTANPLKSVIVFIRYVK